MNFFQQSSSLSVSLLSVAILIFIVPTISATHHSFNPKSNATDFIRTSCNVTLYPDICYTSLSRYAKAVQHNSARLARIAMSVSLSQARDMLTHVSSLSRQTNSGGAAVEPKTIAALHDCYETFDDAVDQMKRSIREMTHLGSGDKLSFQMSNVQTWMSAAITNEETCTDGFAEVLDGPMKLDVCSRASKVKQFTSNGLALVNSFVAQQIGVRRP
ncbi:Pectinesterase inhibitor [Thalictrum thalictroides]|uniref:pectinesterase n=1 Tax=Thalictrum thalictroides TaxID=46969 RepID=A0A7J6WRN3_THATH|nr:Pectinesterase inhibitor [Thalictrum thalictroides]